MCRSFWKLTGSIQNIYCNCWCALSQLYLRMIFNPTWSLFICPLEKSCGNLMMVYFRYSNLCTYVLIQGIFWWLLPFIMFYAYAGYIVPLFGYLYASSPGDTGTLVHTLDSFGLDICMYLHLGIQVYSRFIWFRYLYAGRFIWVGYLYASSLGDAGGLIWFG